MYAFTHERNSSYRHTAQLAARRPCWARVKGLCRRMGGGPDSATTTGGSTGRSGLGSRVCVAAWAEAQPAQAPLAAAPRRAGLGSRASVDAWAEAQPAKAPPAAAPGRACLGFRAFVAAWAEAQPARAPRGVVPGRAQRPARPAPGRCGSSRPQRSACAQRPTPPRLHAHARPQVRAAVFTRSAASSFASL